MASLYAHEVEDRMESLLGSQREFVSAPEKFAMIGGGYGSGKTRAAVLKGLILSAIYPGNEGIIGRYHGTDLEDSTIPVFHEVCPPSWIKSFNKKTNTVTFLNGSKIYFRHIHDAKAGAAKTRRVGANLGWFLIDQAEEIEEAHWVSLVSRLRNPKAGKKFGFGTFNPNGKNWIYKLFFKDEKDLDKDKELFRVVRKRSNFVGIMTNSRENSISNGGFLEDAYVDDMISQMSPEMAARYVYGSFMEFTGKIYKEYGLDTVHNIEPFNIQSAYPHWKCVVSIDVGGDSPWAVVPEYIDEVGNTIVADGFGKSTVLVAEVARWIKQNTPWTDKDTIFICDPENKVAMLELHEHGIYCRPAQKMVKKGFTKTAGYFHVNPKLDLPSWYYETQPVAQIKKFDGKGSPRTFVFKTYMTYRNEHNECVWNPDKPDEMLKQPGKRFDTVDADRYVKILRLDASQLPANTKRMDYLRDKDPASAREAEYLSKHFEHRNYERKGGTGLREAFSDETMSFSDRMNQTKKYQWSE
jgi:hypothetical protein